MDEETDSKSVGCEKAQEFDSPTLRTSKRFTWPKGKPTWNAGKKMNETFRRNVSIAMTGRKVSEETRKKLSNSLKNNPRCAGRRTGGYKEGSGIGKSGWYKGYYCQSSWELAFVISHLDNGIKIERNTKKFSYEFEGKKYNYIPDFIVRDIYIEIKGYKTKRFDAKQQYFPRELKYSVLYKNDMKVYLDYVVGKYGKDFIKLYETEVYSSGEEGSLLNS